MPGVIRTSFAEERGVWEELTKLESSEGRLFSLEPSSGALTLVSEKALFFATNQKEALFYWLDY